MKSRCKQMLRFLVFFVVLAVLASQTSAVGMPNVDLKKSYKSELLRLNSKRIQLALQFRHENTENKKRTIIARARNLLITTISEKLFLHWYGTPWSFEGHSRTPATGSIACGYFVTTLLKQSGLNLNRVRMAQAASETMIKNINQNRNIKRFRGVTIKEFVDKVKQWGEGLYIVGLDNHTGFILNRKNQVYFIHSSYRKPFKVVKEKATESSILRESRYRVLGKLFIDDSLVLAWLNGS